MEPKLTKKLGLPTFRIGTLYIQRQFKSNMDLPFKKVLSKITWSCIRKNSALCMLRLLSELLFFHIKFIFCRINQDYLSRDFCFLHPYVLVMTTASRPISLAAFKFHHSLFCNYQTAFFLVSSHDLIAEDYHDSSHRRIVRNAILQRLPSWCRRLFLLHLSFRHWDIHNKRLFSVFFLHSLR